MTPPRSNAPRAWLCALLVACGASDADEYPKSGASADSFADGGVAAPTVNAGTDDNDPEEAEGDLDFQSPQAGKSVVFVPNAVTNRVAVVNAETYGVETFASGTTPRAVATVPGEDIALVVNEGSSDVSLLRTEKGVTTLLRVPIGHPINTVAIAADGAHAVVYYVSQANANGADTHQDASVLALSGDTPRVWAVSLGFRPRAVRFSGDGQRAFAITEDGVSAITFDDRADVLAVDQIGLGNALSSGAADVQISADGAYAVARSTGRAEVTLVDLASHALSTLALADLQTRPDAGMPDADPGADAGADAGVDAGADAATRLPAGAIELTDLDLSPDGSHAFAVLRSPGVLLDIPLPEGFADPARISVYPLAAAGIGALRVSGDGTLGVLYSTAGQLPGAFLIDLTQLAQPARLVRLRKSVRAVAIAADSAHLLILHSGAQSGGGSSTDPFAASEGFSLVAVSDAFAKFEPTSAPIREADILVSPDGMRVFSLLRAGQGGSVLTSDLATLRTLRTDLARPPSSIGALPAVARVFVGQDSAGGMITFLDQNDGSVTRTLSGFELASRVRQ